jgi:hypothetical protein
LRWIRTLPLLAISSLLALPALAQAEPAGGVTAAKTKQRTSDTLRPGERLAPGQARVSKNRRFALVMGRDGNLVVRDLKASREDPKRLRWTSQTSGVSGASAALLKDGNLVVRKGRNVVFASGTSGNEDARLVVRNDGFAVLYSQDNQRKPWSSRSDLRQLNTGQFLRPGQTRRALDGSLELKMAKENGNLVLFDANGNPVWSSQTGGHPGAFAAMQADGNLVVRATDGTTLYTSGTHGGPGSSLRLLNGGNAVIVSPDYSPLWSAATDMFQLSAGQQLRPGQWRQSPDGRFWLMMHPTGNLVLSDQSTRPGKVVWSTGTAVPGAFAAMQLDGNFVVRAPGQPGATLFHTATASSPAGYLRVRDDANVLVHDAAGQPLWSWRTGRLP